MESNFEAYLRWRKTMENLKASGQITAYEIKRVNGYVAEISVQTPVKADWVQIEYTYKTDEE